MNAKFRIIIIHVVHYGGYCRERVSLFAGVEFLCNQAEDGNRAHEKNSIVKLELSAIIQIFITIFKNALLCVKCHALRLRYGTR